MNLTSTREHFDFDCIHFRHQLHALTLKRPKNKSVNLPSVEKGCVVIIIENHTVNKIQLTRDCEIGNYIEPHNKCLVFCYNDHYDMFSGRGKTLNSCTSTRWSTPEDFLLILLKQYELFVRYFSEFSITKYFEKHSSEYLCKLISQHVELLTCLDVQNELCCKCALEASGVSLQFLRNKTRDLCEFAIKCHAIATKFIPKYMITTFSDLLSLADKTSRQVEELLPHITNFNIIMDALYYQPSLLRCVTNPTLGMCLFAFKRNTRCLLHLPVNKKTIERIFRPMLKIDGLYLEYMPFLVTINEFCCKTAIEQNCKAIQYVNSHLYDILKEAIHEGASIEESTVQWWYYFYCGKIFYIERKDLETLFEQVDYTGVFSCYCCCFCNEHFYGNTACPEGPCHLRCFEKSILQKF
jgi:hypothetical protein